MMGTMEEAGCGGKDAGFARMVPHGRLGLLSEVAEDGPVSVEQRARARLAPVGHEERVSQLHLVEPHIHLALPQRLPSQRP